MKRRLIIKVNKVAILQYVLIYIAAHMTGTFFYNTYPMFMKMLAIGLSLGALLLGRIKFNKEILFAIGGIIASMIISRMINGGIGLGSITDFVVPIFMMYCTMKLDETNFCTRYIKFAVLFALMSVVFWLLATMNFSVFESLMDAISIKYRYSVDMDVYDSFFYALMPENWVKNPRNDSIYSEPAQFSILLNAALWLILFARNKILMKKQTIVRAFVILVIALVTSQTTTGYICFGVMLLAFFFSEKDNTLRSVFKYGVIIIALIGADYLMRGEESLLHVGVFGKVLDSDGTINLELGGSTGKYRMASIRAAWTLVLQRPLGWGVDYVQKYVDMYSRYGEGSAGGGFVMELARYGIITVGIFMGWIIWRLCKNKTPGIAAMSYLFFFVWTTMAQAGITYPFILLPLFVGSFKKVCDSYGMDKKAKTIQEDVMWVGEET